jgi:putative transcriptional regulator
MDSLSGHLLTASPHMADPNFARAVVLIIQHNDQGAFGVVLNRPSQHSIREVWQRIGGEPCAVEQALNLGGPIEGPLIALHANPGLSETEVLPGVHFAARKEALQMLVQEAEHPFLLFSGYAGWGQGQLESELQAGAWLTAPAKADYIFHAPEDLWKQVAQDIGQDVLFSSLRIKHVPQEPGLN